MALNPFFLQGSQSEQFLVQDLINEQLRIYGVEVYYLPRKAFRTDDIIREVQSSKFDDSFLIEAYINNYDGYAPDSDIMSKFGLRLKNEISLTLSRERFEEFISPFLEGIAAGLREGKTGEEYDLNTITRPLEGDLIYFPLGERLFEVKRVEFEKPFYQLGKNYIYELNCELYEYENEEINTSVEEVDNTVEDEGYITTVKLAGYALDATANAVLSIGAVNEIFLNNDGSGYITTPTVEFSDPPNVSAGNQRATAVAITTSVANVQSIDRIEITNAGSGYLEPPTITISGGGGIGAAATCSIGSTQASVQSINIIVGGSGYAAPPEVTMSSPSVGTTATGVAILRDGSVESIRLTNAGLGYTEAPTVSIAGVSTVGVGTFVYNELITGQTSGVTAKVRDFRAIYNSLDQAIDVDLKVYLNTGKFYQNEIIVGSISSARYLVQSHDLDSFEDEYDSNEEFETEADNILDFTESNPFGEY